MEAYIVCQSCGMPMADPQLHGTEENGSCSNQYCVYCYGKGRFTHPGMTMEEMQYNVRRRLEDQGMAGEFITTAVNNIRFLNRWLNRSHPIVEATHLLSI